MGCSNNFDELKYKKDIISVLLSLFENELKIKSLLNDQNNNEYKSEKYILVNNYWIEDYKKYFGYIKIINIIPNIKEKDYYNFKNIKESIIKKIYDNENINDSLKRNSNDINLLNSITTNNRAQNKFFELSNGKAIVPDINTTLIKSEIFDEMIILLKNYIEKNNFNIQNDIIETNVVIANQNIYLNIDNNRYSKYTINNNLIICFLDNRHLRTKYFISFEKENNFDKIINDYIRGNKLENYIKKYRFNLLDINQQDLIIGKNKIGYFFNLIKNNENETSNKIEKNFNKSINNSKNLIEIQINDNKNNNIINENNNLSSKNIIKNNESLINNSFFSEKSSLEPKDMKTNTNININNNKYKKNNNRNNNQRNNIQNNIININIINNTNNIIDNNNNINNINDNNKEQYQINNNDIINNIEEKFPIKRITKFPNNNFINEFIQSLANIDILQKFFKENEEKIKHEIKNFTPFSSRFINTIKYIYNKKFDSNKLFNEEFFKNNYKNSDNKITSFITFLFNSFKEELKELKISVDKSNINEMLFGERRISYECNICNENGGEREPFCFLEYDLLKVFEFNKKLNNDIKSITLKDCFNYNKSNHDNLFCKKCGNNKFSNYSYDIHRLPDIVIIIIENGNINLVKKAFFKANILIDNEDEKKGYELISQINIKENNKYVTFLKSNNNENKWYICQENNILEYNKKELDKGFPFVMIYSKAKASLVEKYIDEFDNIVDLKNEKINLLIYSTVSKIKERIDDVEYDMKLEDIYNELCLKYRFENKTIFFFNNSRKLDLKKSIKENNLENGDLIIIVEYNLI